MIEDTEHWKKALKAYEKVEALRELIEFAKKKAEGNPIMTEEERKRFDFLVHKALEEDYIEWNKEQFKEFQENNK